MKHLAVDVQILVKASVREVVENSVRQHVEDVKVALERAQLLVKVLVEMIAGDVLVDVIMLVQ